MLPSHQLFAESSCISDGRTSSTPPYSDTEVQLLSGLLWVCAIRHNLKQSDAFWHRSLSTDRLSMQNLLVQTIWYQYIYIYIYIYVYIYIYIHLASQ